MYMDYLKSRALYEITNLHHVHFTCLILQTAGETRSRRSSHLPEERISVQTDVETSSRGSFYLPQEGLSINVSQPQLVEKLQEGNEAGFPLPALTKEELFKNVLPNLEGISALITHYKGYLVLNPVPYSKRNQELFRRQHISVLTLDEVEQNIDSDMFHYMLSTKKTLGYIVQITNHFVTLIVSNNLECIYFIDSKPNTIGIKEYPQLETALTAAFPEFIIKDIFPPEQCNEGSLAHAYLNARVLTWGLLKYGMSKENVQEFLHSVTTDPILSNINANLLRFCNSQKEDVDQKKREVEGMITQGIENEEAFSQIEERIKIKGLCKSYRELSYLQNFYIEHVQSQFLNELRESLTFSKISLDIQNLRSITDVSGAPFQDLQSYHLFDKCKNFMNEFQKHTCFEQIWCLFHQFEKVKSERVRLENTFIKELIKCIRYCFIDDDNFFFSYDTGNSFNSSDLLTKICKNTGSPHFVQLANIASDLLGNEATSSETFQDNLKRVLDALTCLPIINVYEDTGKVKISYQNYYVNLQQALCEIVAKLKNDQSTDMENIHEMHVSAIELMVVNQDLPKTQWHARNVVITAREIIVPESCTWDLSGQSALNHEDHKARDGTDHGEDGVAGEHGFHGESGGNVVIVSDHIEKAGNWTIISNGGNGGDGQDGGNGAIGMDGEDGLGLTEAEFKDNFPDPAVILIGKRRKSKRMWQQQQQQQQCQTDNW